MTVWVYYFHPMTDAAATVLETPLAKVRREIADACADAKRDPASVTLVAVSKTFDAEAVEPNPGRATWMKTALPRPATRGRVLWSSSMIRS